MSLTTFIKQKEVKTKLNNYFNMPKFDLGYRKIKANAPKGYKGEDYMLIGTAFDYLFRFFLAEKHNVKEDFWVAHISLALLIKESANFKIFNHKNFLEDMEVYHKNNAINVGALDKLTKIINKGVCSNLLKEVYNHLSQAEKRYKNYINNGDFKESIIKATIDLAKIDKIYRNNIRDIKLGKYKDEHIKDLKSLYQAIPKRDKKIKKEDVYLNPSFSHSSRVDGADADLIINNTLIDIKTTKYLKLKKDYYHQLVGYALLADLDDRFELEKLGIYFSRHGVNYIFDVDNIYSNENYDKFKEWFLDYTSRKRRLRAEKTLIKNANNFDRGLFPNY